MTYLDHPSNSPFSRRDFLKLASLGIGTAVLRPFTRYFPLVQFPAADRLARVAQGRQDLKVRPDPESQTVGVLYEDAVLPWLREVLGERPNWAFNNQRWVETPDGYLYGAYIQPVQNRPNTPLTSLPDEGMGPGMWMEVTVPFVDVALERDPSSNSWISARMEEGLPIRLYYSQVFWVDGLRTDNEQVWYHVNPNFYGGVDMMWVPAEAMRPLTQEDISPIHPEALDKRLSVDVLHQTLSCFEGNHEVYFCRVATGAKFDMYGNVVDKWATPLGNHRVTRKYISLQMAGGTTGAGYDLPGIGWTTIFATGGVAIHSTFWHNNFGDPMSHGCVNTTPEDARWIFRWLMPEVQYNPGVVDITVTGEQSTFVEVREG